MNAKKELQVWVDNTLEYKIIGQKIIRTGSSWTEDGSIACELVDEGDGLAIHFDDKSLNLEYYEVTELIALLVHYNALKIEFVKGKKIKTI